MKRIKLTQGKSALVDDSDFEWLNQWKWHASKCGTMYYATRKKVRNRKQITIRMHRIILGNISPGFCIDHINRNSLDNRKFNLRICKQGENALNRRLQKNNTSGYTGVYWHKLYKKWMVILKYRGKNLFLGYFDKKLMAASVYKKEAQRLRGEFA